METLLFQYLKYPFHSKQFFYLVEIYFKRILYYRQRQQIFCLVETIFFHSHFLETIIAIRRRPIFKKKNLFLPEETVFFNFFRILIGMEVAFRSSEIAFFKESFILAIGNGFSISYKLCAFYSELFSTGGYNS